MVISDWTPTLAQLHCWGHAPDGWFALLDWQETRLDDRGIRWPRTGAGWIPARHVRPGGYDRRTQRTVPRLELPADIDAWPRLWLRDADSVLLWYGRVTASLPRDGSSHSAYG